LVEEPEIPLERWLELRDLRGPKTGERRMVRTDGRRCASHLDPKAPRIVVEFDGFAWQSIAVAEDYAAAQRMLHHIEGDGVMRLSSRGRVVSGAALAAGTGRHRRT
jgi:hypothetical protein